MISQQVHFARLLDDEPEGRVAFVRAYTVLERGSSGICEALLSWLGSSGIVQSFGRFL